MSFCPNCFQESATEPECEHCGDRVFRCGTASARADLLAALDEIARLRAALQQIANTAPPRNMTAANVRTTLSGVQSIARVALESEDE